ncbi:MAG TPA: Ku protein [Anaeromyxobacteraceae bacterium]|nr:Ku protein [Anaeromyxobacteraceae bacterium]
MAPRPTAAATISFGLVSIPIRLYPATSPTGAVSFNLLHAKCNARLRQHYVCTACGEKVEREDMVKGYEFAKDRYVTFAPEELKALDELATQTIDIAEFVPAKEVDPVYFDRAYYVGPDKGGAKAYRLLAEALQRSGKAALARYAARGKGYLVLLRPRDGRLVMQQLLYADEVRPIAEVPLEDASLKDQEVQLALQLIEQTASDAFRPEGYEDLVKKRVLEAIERKVEGEEVRVAAPEPAAQVIDLMDALKASLTAAQHGAAGARPAPAGITPAAAPEAEAETEPARKPARRAARREPAEAPAARTARGPSRK